MKKNLVPLLGIAFVVAVATTGIFYGLFVGKLGANAPVQVVVAAKGLKSGTTLTTDHLKAVQFASSSLPAGAFSSADQVVGRTLAQPVAEGEPVLTATLARGGASGAINSNLRAVSTHVTDSAGVIEMLQNGDHVDVQVLSGKDHGEAEIRTILQNKVVLAIHGSPEPTSHGAAAAPVVTLLVDKNEAEALALADSTARVRLALRNPTDSERLAHAGISFAALLRNGAPKESIPAPPEVTEVKFEKPVEKAQAPTATPIEVQLQVQVLGASPSALEELFKQTEGSGRADVFQAATARRATDLAAAVRSLEQRKVVDVVSTSQVRTGISSSVSLQAGKQDPSAGVRIRFSPSRVANGKVRLQIEPEVTTPNAVRKLDTRIDVADGQPFLIGGLVQAKERAAILDRFFGGRELVVIVTPKVN